MGNDSNNEHNKHNKNNPSTTTRCLVCRHPQRAEFDKALAMREKTAAEIARLVGCHRSSVSDHFHHHLLPVIVVDMQKIAPDLVSLDIPAEMRALYDRIRVQLDAADKTNNWQAIRAFHTEARHDLELLAHLLGELATQPTVNDLDNDPKWIETRTVLLYALEPFPEARIAVAEALMASKKDVY